MNKCEPLILLTVKMEQQAVRNGVIYIFITTLKGVQLYRAQEGKRIDSLNKDMVAMVNDRLTWLPMLSNGTPYIFPSIRDAIFWVDQH